MRSVDVVADLSTPEGRQEAIDGILCEAGRRLDAVIANAGLALPTATTVAVNYFGAVELLDGLRPALAAARAPRAVVTSSMATLMPVSRELVDACLAGDETLALKVAGELEATGVQGGSSIYPSSKRALSRWVRREAASARWAGCGIPLNAVAPGIVETPMVAGLMDDPETAAATDAMVPMPLGGHLQAGAGGGAAGVDDLGGEHRRVRPDHLHRRRVRRRAARRRRVVVERPGGAGRRGGVTGASTAAREEDAGGRRRLSWTCPGPPVDNSSGEIGGFG